MRRPLQVGITGGIGSGKSLVCRIFKSLNVPVYDADSRAKELMTTDDVLVSQIKIEFGTEAYGAGGMIQREYLAQRVFGIPEKLAILNQLVHPRVLLDYDRWVHDQMGHAYVIKEAALLIEAKSAQKLDRLIVVTAPDELRVSRVLQRDKHRTESDVRKIIDSQLPEKEKVKQADFVIVNDESQLVIPQVLALHEQFKREQQNKGD